MNIDGIEFTGDELAVLLTQCGVSDQNICEMLPRNRYRLKTAIGLHIENITKDDNNLSRTYLRSVVSEILSEMHT